MIELIRVTTYNIHKGLSSLNRRMVVHEVRERLSAIGADVVFLQEVLGEHEQHAQRFLDWPTEPQHEFLAGEEWADFAYGRNAIYHGGHHGNAILTRFPISRWDNEDISAHPLESRGLLHCEIEVPGWRQPLHCVNVHLGLAGRWRRQQLEALRKRIARVVPNDAPLVIAGDFNDWRRQASEELIAGLEVRKEHSRRFVAARRGAFQRRCRCSVWIASTCEGSGSSTPAFITATSGRSSPTMPP